MQQIVNVTIDESGRSIADSKSIGLQYETGVAQFVIAPDPSWVSDQYFYYLIVSPPEDSEKKQYAVPLVNQGGTFVFKISSGITWTVGNYKFAFIAMSKELTDGRVPSDGIVSISTAWNCKIEKSILDYVSLQSQPEDANFQLLYTDLMALSVELKNAINNIELEGNYAREQGDEAKKQAEYAKEQGDYAKEKGDYANTKAELANTKAEYANTQGNYAKTQGEQAQTKGNKAQEQGNTAQQQAQYATEQGNYAKRVGDTVQGQIDRLRANQVRGSASGTELVVQDSANMESILHPGGNGEQDSRSGKNKIKLNDNQVTTPGGATVTTTSDTGIITINGTSTSIGNIYPTSPFKVPETKQYMFSIEVENYVATTQYDNSAVILRQSDNGQDPWATVVELGCKTGAIKEKVLSLDATKYYSLRIYAGQNENGFNNVIIKPQLEAGTVKTTFEPYGVQPSPDYPSEIRSVSGDVEVKVEGKNIANFAEGVSYVTYTFINDVATLSGTRAWTGVDFDITDIAKANIGKTLKFYCEDYDFSNGDNVVINLKYTTDSGSSYQTMMSSAGSLYTYKIPNNLTQLVLKFMSNNTNVSKFTSISITKPMLYFVETGEATAYQPYGNKTVSLPLGDIELRSTPDGTRDTFERVDGVWNKVEKAIPFAITEDMLINVDLTYYGVPIAKVSRPKGALNGYIRNICLMTSYKEREGSEKRHGIFNTASSSNYIEIFNENITSLETAKTILVGETGIIKLATPTYTPITDTALISALDELEQLILHKGYNRITATAVNGVKAYLDLSYIKDINTVLNNMSAMLMAIGGDLNV